LEGEKKQEEIRTFRLRWWRAPATLTAIISVVIAGGTLVVSWRDAREKARNAELDTEKADVQKTKLENEQWDIKRQTVDLAAKNDELQAGRTKLELDNADLAKKKAEYEEHVKRIGEAIRDNGSLENLLAAGPAATLLRDVLYPVRFAQVDPPGWPAGKKISASASLASNGKLTFAWIIDPNAIHPAQFKAPATSLEITPLSKDKPKILKNLPVPDLKFVPVMNRVERTRHHSGREGEGGYDEKYYEYVPSGFTVTARNTEAAIDYGETIVPEVVANSQLRLVTSEAPK
jgi:hypothetical protein